MLSKKRAAISCAVGLGLHRRNGDGLGGAGYLQAEKQRISKDNRKESFS